MDEISSVGRGILALFPFLLVGSLPVAVMREMRARGHDVTVASYLPAAHGYTTDPLEDFAAEGRLIDLSGAAGSRGVDRLEAIVLERDIGLILQIGAPEAYAQLARLKERRPGLRLVDTLYNTGEHFHAFAHRGSCFDGVLVESSAMVRLLEGAPHGAWVRQVESGVDIARFTPGGRAVHPPGSEFVLGYVGRMSPEKNPLGFVALAEALHACRPGLSFVMFGEGGMATEVKARIATSPARAAITFAGFADHPTTALGAIDILVLPSVLDGRPASIMEAGACGVPVIAAPVGGIPDLIEEGRNGFLASPLDSARIAGLLDALLKDPARFHALRVGARQVAEARFDRNRMMNAYEAAYQAALATPARPLASLA